MILKPVKFRLKIDLVSYSAWVEGLGKYGPGYDTKQSDGRAPVMLNPRGMRSTLSLPLHLDPLWPGVGASDSGLSMKWIELFNIDHMEIRPNR